jgi:hypothetical protein
MQDEHELYARLSVMTDGIGWDVEIISLIVVM